MDFILIDHHFDWQCRGAPPNAIEAEPGPVHALPAGQSLSIQHASQKYSWLSWTLRALATVSRMAAKMAFILLS